jgi:hypothetical protein
MVAVGMQHELLEALQRVVVRPLHVIEEQHQRSPGRAETTQEGHQRQLETMLSFRGRQRNYRRLCANQLLQ